MILSMASKQMSFPVSPKNGFLLSVEPKSSQVLAALVVFFLPSSGMSLNSVKPSNESFVSEITSAMGTAQTTASVRQNARNGILLKWSKYYINTFHQIYEKFYCTW